MARGLSGILLVDKPEDWTSHDVVAKLRGITRQRRIGHSGTLDPLATGLLVIFLGRATRAVEFAESDTKEYIAGLRLGVSTDTQDISGTVLRECDGDVTSDELEAALARFRGEQEQIPPMYSAVKHQGKKLYEIARKGGEVERKPRKINISRLECTERKGGDFTLRVECSKGTYIRTLCADIGAELGCGGCMSSLRRTRAGRFHIDDAHSLREIEESGAELFLLPVASLFYDYGAITINPKAEQRLRSGAAFPLDAPDSRHRLYSENGEFLALGRAESGMMYIEKSFFEV